MRSPEALSADEARRLHLWAQGLLGAPDRRGGVPALLRRVGCVQLDTISVLARSHELVAYARLGPVGRAAIEAAYWNGDAFEYWGHAASVIPIEDWPWFEVRRRHGQAGRAEAGRAGSDRAVAKVRAKLAEGPITTADVGGAKRGGVWWDWSEAKVALERLLDAGEVVCVQRRGWRRVYDLAERAIPADLLAQRPTDHECWVWAVREGAARLGVGTRRDIADYYRLKLGRVDECIGEAGLVPVSVAGWDELAWAHPDALVALRAGLRGRHRTTLLSPFDSLVWDRARTERVFGLFHRLEAYVPAPLRVHGYFAMPVLAGGRLVGRVDPKREGRTLVARRVGVIRPAALPAIAEALVEAAAWVGCDQAVVEAVDPPSLAASLRALVEGLAPQ